jgi:hypothetical protein
MSATIEPQGESAGVLGARRPISSESVSAREAGDGDAGWREPVRVVRRGHAREELVEWEGPAARAGVLLQGVVRRIRERPMTAVAVAVGVGFVVGGALTFRAGRFALAAAVRRVAREVLKQVL